MEAAIGIEPMNKGFADLCLTTWLRRRKWKQAVAEGGRQVDQIHRLLHSANCLLLEIGAGDEGRTRDFDLGKVALYH